MIDFLFFIVRQVFNFARKVHVRTILSLNCTMKRYESSYFSWTRLVANVESYVQNVTNQDDSIWTFSLAPRNHIHPPKIAQVMKTKGKPKCSLWVFRNCPKLACDLQVVATSFLIGLWIIILGSMNSSSKRSFSPTPNSS
jgi:hypothetical protein